MVAEVVSGCTPRSVTAVSRTGTGAPRRRRVSRRAETSTLVVAAAVPEGCGVASSQREWLMAVERAVDRESWYDSRRRSVLLWAREVASHVDISSMTTRYTTSDVLRATGRRSSTTMKSYRRWAESRGLLAEVAPGRSGVWAPASTNASTRPDGTVVVSNDAAVRVLLIPLSEAEEIRSLAACGGKLPPSPCMGRNRSPRAHAKGSINNFEPLRGTETHRLAAVRPGQWLPANRWRPWWKRAVTKSKDEAVVASARLLAEDVPTLRSTTDRWVAHVIRPFVAAGWTVADLQEAIDQRPDGRSWTYDLREVRRAEYWLKYRLDAWIDHGTVLPSARQKRAAEHKRVMLRRERAIAQAEAERRRIDSIPRSRLLAGRLKARRALLDVADSRRRPAAQKAVDELTAELEATLAAESAAREFLTESLHDIRTAPSHETSTP